MSIYHVNRCFRSTIIKTTVNIIQLCLITVSTKKNGLTKDWIILIYDCPVLTELSFEKMLRQG